MAPIFKTWLDPGLSPVPKPVQVNFEHISVGFLINQQAAGLVFP